ncbi:nuclear transport factor 2 family protein [Aurantivibrio plasticivorans]
MPEQMFSEFKQFYTHFSDHELGKLDVIYAKDVVFTDPIHSIKGRAALHHYFADLCENVEECRFEFLDELVLDNAAYIKWDMHFSHPKIQKGHPLTLRGVTQLQFGKDGISYHEDFYDMGAMLYEHVPVIGRCIRWLKRNLAER